MLKKLRKEMDGSGYVMRSFFSIYAGYHRRRNFPRPGAPEEMRRRAALKCGHGRQYNWRWGRRSHWRPLRGAARLHGSCEPWRELRAWLQRSVQPTEV